VTPIHISAGVLSLACGAVALAAPKGSALHRRAGTWFTCAMLVMSGTGAIGGALRGQSINVVAGSLVFYLVATGWLAAQPPSLLFRRLGMAALAMALVVGVGGMATGFGLLGGPHARFAPVVFVFSGVALLGGWGDFRMLTRGVEGRRRTVRHLWHMGVAMLIATLAFFLGQARFLPPAAQKPALLAIPILLVLLVVLYWLGRMLFARRMPVPQAH